MERNYTVYALIDPRNECIRYIGRTQKILRERLYEHISQSDGEKRDWIRELRAAELKPLIIALEENLSFEEAKQREIYWIKYYLSLDTPLLNMSQAKPPKRYSDSPWAQPGWACISDAAKELNIPADLISRLADRGIIQTKRTILSRRVKLVNLEEIKKLI